MRDIRVNTIMMSCGRLSSFFFERWVELFRSRNNFAWRILDYYSGKKYEGLGTDLEVEYSPRMKHGEALNYLYATKRHRIEIFCDLDSFPASPNSFPWIRDHAFRYALLGAEDRGPIRDHPGKLAPSFICVTDETKEDLDFADRYPSHDTAHCALSKLERSSYLLLKQSPSGYGNGTYYCDGNERIWHHQWYLRKEDESCLLSAQQFFKVLRELGA